MGKVHRLEQGRQLRHCIVLLRLIANSSESLGLPHFCLHPLPATEGPFDCVRFLCCLHFVELHLLQYSSVESGRPAHIQVHKYVLYTTVLQSKPVGPTFRVGIGPFQLSICLLAIYE